MNRLTVKSWYLNSWETLHHSNGLTKRIALYTPEMDGQDSVWCLRRREELGIEGIDDIAKIAMYVGAYSTLWIGTLDGILAPMDIPPEGWSFESGEIVEPSWFWQWHPSDKSAKRLLANLSETNSLEVENPSQVFKTLVPFNSQEKRGVVSSIQAIDLVSLPDLIRPGIDFVFEY